MWETVSWASRALGKGIKPETAGKLELLAWPTEVGFYLSCNEKSYEILVLCFKKIWFCFTRVIFTGGKMIRINSKRVTLKRRLVNCWASPSKRRWWLAKSRSRPLLVGHMQTTSWSPRASRLLPHHLSPGTHVCGDTPHFR